jgi:hypothetical protein
MDLNQVTIANVKERLSGKKSLFSLTLIKVTLGWARDELIKLKDPNTVQKNH